MPGKLRIEGVSVRPTAEPTIAAESIRAIDVFSTTLRVGRVKIEKIFRSLIGKKQALVAKGDVFWLAERKYLMASAGVPH